MICEQTFFTIACDHCDESFGEDYTLVFDSVAAAHKALAEADWVRVEDHRILCDSCADRAACDLLGHAMGGWDPLVNSLYIGRRRRCANCGAAELDPPFEGAAP